MRSAPSIRGKIHRKLTRGWTHLRSSYNDDNVVYTSTKKGPNDEEVIISKLPTGKHIVAIDIDHPCELVPSRTKGHYHLYIDVEMEWEKLKNLLWSMSAAGIVEPGYASACTAQGFTVLRVPTVEQEAQRLREAMERSGKLFPEDG